MAYIEKDFIAVNHIEREFYFQGKYGAKGEKRERKNTLRLRSKSTTTSSRKRKSADSFRQTSLSMTIM